MNGQGFMELIKVLEPRYNMESRSHITNTVLPKMYAELRDTVKRKLGEAKFLSSTTDGWTGRNSKSFNTVTILAKCPGFCRTVPGFQTMSRITTLVPLLSRNL